MGVSPTRIRSVGTVQAGRGVEPGRVARGRQHRRNERGGAALAVGARDVDGRSRQVRVAQPLHEEVHALQVELRVARRARRALEVDQAGRPAQRLVVVESRGRPGLPDSGAVSHRRARLSRSYRQWSRTRAGMKPRLIISASRNRMSRR